MKVYLPIDVTVDTTCLVIRIEHVIARNMGVRQSRMISSGPTGSMSDADDGDTSVNNARLQVSQCFDLSGYFFVK